MDYKRAAAANFFWISAGQFLTRILGAAFFFYLAFKLGEQMVGVFSFIFSFLSLWFILGELGLFQYLTRKWARHEGNWQEDFSLTFYIKSFTSLLILVFLIFYILFYDQNIWLELILVFAASYLDQPPSSLKD
jgi:O-antigen/teichoic acid export membrane protein